MRVVLLAAGYATRLYPLTKNFPKPLLEIGGKPILNHLIDDLEADEFVVISNHKFASFFEEWAKRQSKKIVVVDDGTSSNETRLGAVKDIEFALDQVGYDQDTFVMVGDNVLDFSLNRLLEFAREKEASCVMRIYEESIAKLQKCGVLQDDGEVAIGLEEKPLVPKSHYICAPFYYYKKDDIARIKEAIADGCGVDAPGSLLGWVCTHSKVYVMDMPGKRYDVGSLESYQQIKAQFDSMTIDK